MGNTGEIQKQKTSNEQQNHIQVYRHSQIYGRYRMKDNQIIKQFQIESSRFEQFMSLVKTYQSIQRFSIIKILKIQQLDPQSQSKTRRFLIYLPNYNFSLSAQIYERKLQQYKEIQIVQILSDICQALQQFQIHKFEYQTITSDKIVVNQTEEGQKRYMIGLDMLVNYQSFIKKQNQQKKNHRFDPNIHELGKIVMKMIHRQEYQQDIQRTLFQMRQKYSLDFLQILNFILIQRSNEKVNMSILMQKIRKIQFKYENNQIDSQNRLFIPGFNSLEFLQIDRCEVSLQHRIKWNSIVNL